MYPVFLEPYDKVIHLRKKYGITQKELSGGFYSQAYITKLETKKQEPTEENLIFFACQLNKLFKEKKIPDVICYKELKRSKEESIEKFYKEKLIEIQKITDHNEENSFYFEELLKQLEIYANYFTNRQKFNIFKEIYKKAYLLEKYNVGKTYSFNFLLEAMLLKEEEIMQDALIILTRCCILSEDYKYIYELQNLLEPYFDKFKPKNKEIIYLNLSVILGRLENYTLSLKYLTKIEEEIEIQRLEFSKEVHKAFILEKMLKFKEAKQLYISLIKRKDRPKEILIWSKINLLIIFKKLNLKEEFRKDYFYLKKHILEGDRSYLKVRYKILAETAIELNKKSDAILFFNKALDKEKEDKLEDEDIGISFDCIKQLAKLYQKKDLEKVLELESKYFNLLKKSKNIEPSFHFIEYYSKHKFYNNLSDFITKINLSYTEKHH